MSQTPMYARLAEGTHDAPSQEVVDVVVIENGLSGGGAGDHTHTGLLTGSASAVNDSTATDAAGLVTDFNALLAALRARGIITGS
ncbi:head fiber protein [Streptomyces sp. NPDC056112]|uniref:head fiber protein n=1 Tax=Streptomyces sp. NPDC056112 TaxID=3345715 RepID=UPI0035E05C6F